MVIVGAGLAGIGAACHLRDRLPHKSFAILEARDVIGGTWDLFRYPGVRSDSDHHTYGFSFAPWTDDETLASGDAILGYLQRVLDEHDIGAHVRFGRRVVQVEWSTRDARWTVTTEDTRTGERSRLTCSWVLATTGYFRYDHGHQPEFPGADRFRGALVDPQHWPADLDVAGKRIVVIGSGATAATLVPALAGDAEHVTMLQRSPSYFLPLPTHDPVARLFYRVLPRERAYAWTREKNRRTQAVFHRLSRARPRAMKRLLVNLTAKQLPEGYDVERHFTPEYAPWDQRVCFLPERRPVPRHPQGPGIGRHRHHRHASPSAACGSRRARSSRPTSWSARRGSTCSRSAASTRSSTANAWRRASGSSTRA